MVIGAISSIVAAIAAVIAAYFAVISHPRKVKDINVEIEQVKPSEENYCWEVEFSVTNLDYNSVLNDAMVSVNTEGITLVRIIPKSHGGLLMMPNVVLDNNLVNFSIEKLKPRTKIVATIKIQAEAGLYNLTWHGNGTNFKRKEGNLVLELAK